MDSLIKRMEEYIAMPVDLEKGKQYLLEAMYPKTIDLELSEEMQQRVVRIAVDKYKRSLKVK